MSARRCPQIALLIDTATDWGRQVIRGIRTLCPGERRLGHPAEEQRCQYAAGTASGRLAQARRYHARVADRAMARYLAAVPGVVVNVSAARTPGVHFPRVTADLRVAARLATEHLLNQGFRNVAYFATLGISYVNVHYHSFVERVAQSGFGCHLFLARRGTGSFAAWQRHEKDLQRWLEELPKPVAVLTFLPFT